MQLIPSGFIALISLSFGFVWSVSIVQELLYVTEAISVHQRIELMRVDREVSVYTWLSVVMLFTASLLLYKIAQAKEVRRWSVPWWYALSLAFFVLSADEGLRIHERIGGLVTGVGERIDYLGYDWVVVYIPLTIIFGVAFIPFLQQLHPRSRLLFIVSGLIYATGAAGFEMISAKVIASVGIETVLHALVNHIEEGMEAVGIMLFVYAVAGHAEIIKSRAVAQSSL